MLRLYHAWLQLAPHGMHGLGGMHDAGARAARRDSRPVGSRRETYEILGALLWRAYFLCLHLTLVASHSTLRASHGH